MHRQHHQQRQLGSAPRILALASASGLFFACSGGEVDLGGGSLSRDLRTPPRCADAGVVDQDLQITNQRELDALRGCEQVHGLRIEPFPEIDLTALASLRVVTDAFQLGASPINLPEGAEEQEAFLAEDTALLASGWVYDLHGLEALESVETLYMTGVAIENFAELESLTSLGSLLPANTLQLRDMTGLENAPVETIWVTNAPELESLNGLAITPERATLIFMAVPKLADIDALVDVEYADSLILSGTGLSTLPSFPRLAGMDSLDIDNNAQLTSIDSVGAFQFANSIYVAANPRLASLPRFESLISFDTLTVLGNDSIESLDLDFPALQPDVWYFEQSEVPINPPLLDIGYNAALERVTLHQSLRDLQFLGIYNNGELSELDFGGLTSANAVFITENPALSLALAPSLRSVDHLEITNNPALSVAAFEQVQTIERVFSGNADPDPAPSAGLGEPAEPAEPPAP